jgi:hypothetical protein
MTKTQTSATNRKSARCENEQRLVAAKRLSDLTGGVAPKAPWQLGKAVASVIAPKRRD